MNKGRTLSLRDAESVVRYCSHYIIAVRISEVSMESKKLKKEQVLVPA